MTDKYADLRLALDRVKPCGQWRKVRKHIDVLESDEWAEAKIEVWSGNKAVVRPKIAGYVFAAKPDTVAALLTERDELLAQAEAVLLACKRVDRVVDGVDFSAIAAGLEAVIAKAESQS